MSCQKNFPTRIIAAALISLCGLFGCSVSRPSFQAGQGNLIVHGKNDLANIQIETISTMRAIAAFMQIPPPEHPLRIVHFKWWLPRRMYLQSACPRLSDATAGCFINADGEFEIVFSGSWQSSETKRLLRHEITHYVIASKWPDIPPWLDEGLSRFFEMGVPYGQPHPRSLKALQKQLHNTPPEMLEKLVRIPPGQKLTHAQYDQAWGLTWFLLTNPTVGPSGITTYTNDIRWPDDPSERFRLHFGVTPAQTQKDWQQAILSATP